MGLGGGFAALGLFSSGYCAYCPVCTAQEAAVAEHRGSLSYLGIWGVSSLELSL